MTPADAAAVATAVATAPPLPADVLRAVAGLLPAHTAAAA